MLYINIIGDDFDTKLFSNHELDHLDNLIKANYERMDRHKSVKFPNLQNLTRLNYPKYAPPLTDKFQIMAILGKYMQRDRTPKKPLVPKFATNTQLCTYVHRRYIYEQYLLEELRRQNSYHKGYLEAKQKAKLQHHHDINLSRAMSRRMSQKRVV